jgi:hypothetical protein
MKTMPAGAITPEVPKQVSPSELPDAGDVSSIEVDELAYEQSAEHVDDILHAEGKTGNKPSDPAAPIDVGLTVKRKVAPKDSIVIEVEKILEDGVGSFYEKLPEEAKDVFKRKGEETASEISEMVRTLHVKFKRLIVLISDWLKTIPGVNRFFLEQEAKIKADRIMQLVEARKLDQDKKV